MTMVAARKTSGFTLIQISVLLTIVSLTLVFLLPNLQGNLSSNNATTAKLNAVFSALRNYESQTGTLPCPADAGQYNNYPNFGVAASYPGPVSNCTNANFVDSINNIAVGMVPVQTLGLPYTMAFDSYGRDITYAVDTRATTCWSNSAFTGKITVTDNGAANNTVAVLVSHGADGHGAFLPLISGPVTFNSNPTRLNAGIGTITDPDQLTNAHVDTGFNPTTPLTNFVRKNLTGTFDDLVVYKNPNWNINQIPQTYQLQEQVPTVSGQPANGNYYYGQTLTFVLTFGNPVTVTYTPRLDITAIGTGTNIGSGSVAYASYISGSGTSALTFSYVVSASDYAPNGIALATSIDTSTGSLNPCPLPFAAPNLTAVKLGETLWVGDSLNNRIQGLSNLNTWVASIGGPSPYTCESTPAGSPPACAAGSGNGQFGSNGTNYIALDPSGNIWTTDQTNGRIQEFSATGTYKAQFGSIGTGECQFAAGMGGIAVVTDPNNASLLDVWVADTANNRVQDCQFNPSNNTVTWLETVPDGVCPTSACPPGSGTARFNNVVSVKVGTSGTTTSLWTVDHAGVNPRTRQWILNKSANTATFNTQVAQNTPDGFAFDPSGNPWEFDAGNVRVVKYDPVGGTNVSFRSVPAGCFSSASTHDMTIDGNGNYWITEPAYNYVIELNNTASTVLATFPCTTTCGTACPTGSGKTNLDSPMGIVLSR